LTGIIFGLGLSELVLILVFIILILGPKRMKTIKPFMKVAYKNYVKYMREVDAMQDEMDDMKKTLMEPIEEVKKEAVSELKDVETDLNKNMEGMDELKKGMRVLVDQSKKEMAQARAEADQKRREMEGSKKGKKTPVSGAHISRGSQVGLLGKQGPGASRRMPHVANGGRTQQKGHMQNRFAQRQNQARSNFRFGGAKQQGMQRNQPNQQRQMQRTPPQKQEAPAPTISASDAIVVEAKPKRKETSKPGKTKTPKPKAQKKPAQKKPKKKSSSKAKKKKPSKKKGKGR
jgi:Sec-independent protein translocase protein TatA